ncbi:MAG: hypothetical protein A2X47_07550 [Lentisphaerae bacterium GWF2_38_69]|nr:MAG: hypothetical protein A2X47_07550 [Lentisphaerae bacterium GWF2_38_69]
MDHDLVLCPNCKLIYANPQYTSQELVEIYKQLYYNEDNTFKRDNRIVEQNHNSILYSTTLRDLIKRHPQLRNNPKTSIKNRVLDYGCGPGYFLNECRKFGFEVIGIEFSEYAAKYAQEKLDLDVRIDPDSALNNLPDNYFQLITAWSVLEHTRHPKEVLAKLIAKLTPDGILCLTVPNLACWRHFLEHNKWFNITNPTHLVFFNWRNLKGLLTEMEMKRIIRPKFWGGRPGFNFFANLIQYFVRLTGFGSDLRIYSQRCEK